MTDRNGSPIRRLETLDLMRGVAALAVLIFHCAPPALRLAEHGYLAVDLFFALSGFVIAAAYAPKLLTTMSVADFLRIRLKRLYPLIVLGALLGFVGLHRAYGLRDLLILLVTGLLLLPTPLGSRDQGDPAMGINPPSWSLFWELLVNILYARWAVRWSLRTLYVILILSGIVLIFNAFHDGQIAQGTRWFNWWGGAPRVVFSFTLGVIVYHLRGRLTWTLPVPIIALLTIVLLFLPVFDQWNAVYDIACIFVAFPILLVAGINSHAPRLVRLSVLMGQASYPAYILQGGVNPHIKGVWNHVHLSPAAMTVATIAMAIAFFFGAWLISKPYEYVVKLVLPKVRRVKLPAQAAP